MPLLFDYNPDTGVTQYFDYDESSDVIAITSVQDHSAVLDEMARLRNTPEAWKKGVKESFALFAKITPLMEMEMRKKGLDVYNKNHTKAIIKEIEQNYPMMKATEAKLWRPRPAK